MSQPEWAQTKELELDRVSAINLLSRKEGDQNVNIDLWVDRVALVPPAPAVVGGTGSVPQTSQWMTGIGQPQ